MGRSARRPVVWTWAALTVVFWGLSAAKSFFIPLCLAVLLAFVMAPLLQFLRRLRVPEALGIVVCALVVLVPVFFAASTLIREIEMLIREFPEISRKLNQQLAPYFERFHVSGFPSGFSSMETGVHVALAGLKAVFEAGTEFLLILFFALLMLANRKALHRSAHRIFDHHFEGESAGAILDSSVVLIERFLATRLWIAVSVTVIDFIVLTAFRVPFAFLLSSFMGLMTWVPAVGFILGVVPPLMAVWTAGGSMLRLAAIYIVLAVVALVNDHWVTPRLLGRSLNLTFFATCLGIFAGERLWGLWGMFLSVPILGVIRVILDALEGSKPWSELVTHKKEAA